MKTPITNGRRLTHPGQGEDGRSAFWRVLWSSRRRAWLIAAPLALATAVVEPAEVYKRAPVQPPPGRAVPDTAPAQVYSARISSPSASIANTITDLNTGATPAVFRVVFDPEGARRLPTLIDPSKYQPNDYLIPVESCERVPVVLRAVVTLGAGSPYNMYHPPSHFLFAKVGNQTVDGGSVPFAEPGTPQSMWMREPVLLGPGLHTVDFRLHWNLPAQALPLPEVGLRAQFEIRCTKEVDARRRAPAFNPNARWSGDPQPHSGNGNVTPPHASSTAGGVAPAGTGAAPNWGAAPVGRAAAPAAAPAPAVTLARDALPAQRGPGRLTFTAARLGTLAYEQVDLEPARGRLRAVRREDREVTLLQQMTAQGTVEPVVRVAFADSEYELSEVLVSAFRYRDGVGSGPSRYAIDLQFSGIRRLR